MLIVVRWGVWVTIASFVIVPAFGQTTVTVTVPGTAGPWSQPDNLTFDYGVHDNTVPVVITASSGVSFTAGATITITRTGGVVSGWKGNYPYTDANGWQSFPTYGYTGVNGVFPGRYLASESHLGALVGTFANNNGVIVGRPFFVGNSPTTLTVPASATQLLLGINDNLYSDNDGSFTVKITAGCQVDPDSVKLDTLYDGTAIMATFKPRIGGIAKSLAEAASDCGFAGFAWYQIVDRYPAPGLKLGQLGTPVLQVPSSLPFFDPPLGGYTYQWKNLPLWSYMQPRFATANPFYYSPLDIPTGCAVAGAAAGQCLVPISPDVNTLKFYDIPHNECLPGGTYYKAGNTDVCGLLNPLEFMGFTTDLVGF